MPRHHLKVPFSEAHCSSTGRCCACCRSHWLGLCGVNRAEIRLDDQNSSSLNPNSTFLPLHTPLPPLETRPFPYRAHPSGFCDPAGSFPLGGEALSPCAWSKPPRAFACTLPACCQVLTALFSFLFYILFFPTFQPVSKVVLGVTPVCLTQHEPWPQSTCLHAPH